MFLKPRLLVIATALLLLAGARGTQAQEIKLVSPGDYEDMEGEDGVPENCCGPFRVQYVFPAEDFAVLDNKPHWLVDFTFRPDESVTSPRTVYAPDTEYRLTTMPVGPPNLSSNFAVNLGSDFKHFYRGPQTVVADVAGPGPGPREFYDTDYPGFTPYLYDPSQGNLLLDEISRQGWSPSPRGDLVPGMRRGLSSGSLGPLSPEGDFHLGAVVHQFTFIPALETATWNVDAGGNWSLPTNWASGFPNLTGAQAVLGSVITAPRTVTVNSPITVGRLDFDNANDYTIAGPSHLTLDATSGDAEMNVISGSHTIFAPVTLADNTTITVTPPASSLALTGPLNFVGKTLTKLGAGTLEIGGTQSMGTGATLAASAGTTNINTSFGASQRLGTLSVGDGAIARITAGGVKNVVTTALTIAGGDTPTGTLDVTNNGVVVDYPAAGPNPAAQIRTQINSGRGAPGLIGTWDGEGITSSTSAGAPDSTSVGYAVNGDLPLGAVTTFRGETVDASSVLIRHTRIGDANLDGVVNDDDVTIVGSTYAPGVPQAAWALGDFDYNGFVDDDDVTLIGAFYNTSAAPLAAPSSGATVAAVPEPGSLVLALLAAAGTGIYVVRRRAV
ncbi:MAG TPA: PEP-CTERM sorting domain-containing protein [Pirellulales bacterium]|nr:PEP-CTERM sorting domain-containing protein [Pirellulales bacterium]